LATMGVGSSPSPQPVSALMARMAQANRHVPGPTSAAGAWLPKCGGAVYIHAVIAVFIESFAIIGHAPRSKNRAVIAIEAVGARSRRAAGVEGL